MRRLLCFIGWHRPGIHVAGPVVQCECVDCGHVFADAIEFNGRGWTSVQRPNYFPG